jgi:hypothetical protein
MIRAVSDGLYTTCQLDIDRSAQARRYHWTTADGSCITQIRYRVVSTGNGAQRPLTCVGRKRTNPWALDGRQTHRLCAVTILTGLLTFSS